MDCLKTEGKEPEAREMLTILVMAGAKIDRHFLSREVGIGSRSHCLSGADLIRRVISSTVAGWKDVKLAGGEGGSGVCGDDVVGGMADWSRKILSEKKDEKDFAVADGSVDELDGTDVVELRCRMELMVCQSLRGSDWLAAMRLEWYSRLAARSDLW